VAARPGQPLPGSAGRERRKPRRCTLRLRVGSAASDMARLASSGSIRSGEKLSAVESSLLPQVKTSQARSWATRSRNARVRRRGGPPLPP